MIGPILVYFALAWLMGREVLAMTAHGWAIPTATDIAFSYLIGRIVFGAGHPAIRFLLLLAIADDAGGLIILAVFYPTSALVPLWLLLSVAAALSAYLFFNLLPRLLDGTDARKPATSNSSSDTPTMRQPGMKPDVARWYRPGSNLRRARSPVAPNSTTTCGKRGPTPGGTLAMVTSFLMLDPTVKAAQHLCTAKVRVVLGPCVALDQRRTGRRQGAMSATVKWSRAGTAEPASVQV